MTDQNHNCVYHPTGKEEGVKVIPHEEVKRISEELGMYERMYGVRAVLEQRLGPLNFDYAMDEIEVEDLDKQAFEGVVFFNAPLNYEFNDNYDPDYRTMLINPTWIEVFAVVNLWMNPIGYKAKNTVDHIALEGIHRAKMTVNGHPVYEFSMGS